MISRETDALIERAIMHARRDTAREVDQMLDTPGMTLSALRQWCLARERMLTTALEQARATKTGFPEHLRPPAVDADAKAMVEGMVGVGHSVVVEHEGKRAVFRVTGWSKDIHALHLEPQVDL